MPNHVAHRVTVRGPAPDRALFEDTFLPLQTVTDDDGESVVERCFDFNILIPMPALVQETESSSAVNHGLIVIGAGGISDLFASARSHKDAVKAYLAMPWVRQAGVTTYEELRHLLLEHSPDCVEEAQKALRAYQAHGHASWYTWSIRNWGTKWNAYGAQILEQTDDRLLFGFDTAWSPPTPIFDALAKREEVKNVLIDIVALDECANFGYIGTISGGHHLGQIVEATNELCAAFVGSSGGV